ncbi:MAG: GNAT family N-acetyltransferase [Candidatus Thorarchaeota archaeon]
MRDKPVIRPMTIYDWDGFHKSDREIFPDDSILENWFNKRVQRDGFFALEKHGQIIGQLILALFGENEGHIGRIGIDKEHQGEGYGDLLMEYAIKWFRKYKVVKQVHLYTQDHNKVAQNLYKKCGFRISGDTWHYFIPYDSLNPLNIYTCQEILEDEIDPVGEKYADTLPAAQIRRFQSSVDFHVLTLKNTEGEIVGACRFTPSFPGCFPFVLDNLDSFDDFLFGLKPFSLPDYNYYRITFTDYPKLAQICEERKYKLHHRLYKMTRALG